MMMMMMMMVTVMMMVMIRVMIMVMMTVVMIMMMIMMMMMTTMVMVMMALSYQSGFSRTDLNETNKQLFAFSSRNECHDLSEVFGEDKTCAQRSRALSTQRTMSSRFHHRLGFQF